MNILALDSTIDRIKAYYMPGGESIKLTAHEEETRQIWEAAWTHLLNFKEAGTKEATVSFLMKTYNRSQAQAYRDINNAEKIFGDIRKSSKEAIRYLALEWARELYARACRESDFDGMEKALKHLIRAGTLDKEDMDLPDPSKIQPPVQILQINIDFLTSQFSKVIDEKAKEKINKLMAQINAILEKSRISDYLDQTIDVPMIEDHDSND